MQLTCVCPFVDCAGNDCTCGSLKTCKHKNLPCDCYLIEVKDKDDGHFIGHIVDDRFVCPNCMLNNTGY